MKISIDIRVKCNIATRIKRFAPGEARTHGLQIMRLTRCLLRYGGLVLGGEKFYFQESRRSSPKWIFRKNMNGN